MARTARSKIREARQRKGTIDEMISIADDGFDLSARKDKRVNPLAEFIDDATFAELQKHGVFNDKSLRDYQIRKNYREMRQRMASADAIEKLRESYPYLQYDTIRKIIYASKIA